MNYQNFKNISGVCENSDVLEQIDNYLFENAHSIKDDIYHSINIYVKGCKTFAEISGGHYAHDNLFRVTVINGNDEIGYCETLRSNYL